MHKLELKHLLAYLPYNVKVNNTHILHLGKGVGSINHMLTTKSEKYKLQLHPISSLTKQIEEKGEMFFPLERINDLMPNCPNWIWIISNTRELLNTYSIEDTNIEYCIVQKLISWHFNVFNLSQELFVDKSTIKKPLH